LIVGDVFVLRQLSPSITVGGGVVLSTEEYRYKRSSLPLKERLEKSYNFIQNNDFFNAALCAGGQFIVHKSELSKRVGMTQEKFEQYITVNEKLLIPLPEEFYCVSFLFPDMIVKVKKALARFHEKYPYSRGADALFMARLMDVSQTVSIKLIRLFPKQSNEFIISKGKLALRSFEPTLTAKQLDWRDKIMGYFEEHNDQVVSRKNIQTLFSIPEKEFRLLLKILIEEECVVAFDVYLTAHNVMLQYKQILQELWMAEHKITLQDFRAITKTSRNHAVCMLEYFDKQGFTKRQGDCRILQLKES
jgi:selenocysteine-specific elongation factor